MDSCEGGRDTKDRNECHRKKQARKAEKREMERNFWRKEEQTIDGEEEREPRVSA